jgi:hypothetical protein
VRYPFTTALIVQTNSVILGAVLAVSFILAAPDSRSQSKTQVAVSDPATALKIAEHTLVKEYGKQRIDSERPLTAKLEGGIWIVYGTLCCPDRNGHRTCEEGKCVGGVAILKLRQSDGKILSITHTK